MEVKALPGFREFYPDETALRNHIFSAWRTVATRYGFETAPLFAVIALMVRFSSPGPILFRQKRVGQHGRVVDVLKFRGVQQNIESARKAADAGKLDEARSGYLAAIAASPESAFLYRELAAIENKSGDRASALVHARQAVTLDPSDTKALLLIGRERRPLLRAREVTS